MKNKLGLLAVLVIGLALVLGCGIGEKIQKAVEGDKSSKSGTSNGSSDDKSLEDKAVDTAFEESSGVPECDEVIETINKQAKSKDDNWASKAIKGYFFEQIKKSIKEAIEKNKNDKAKVAEQCRDFKKQVDKALAEEKDKQ